MNWRILSLSAFFGLAGALLLVLVCTDIRRQFIPKPSSLCLLEFRAPPTNGTSVSLSVVDSSGNRAGPFIDYTVLAWRYNPSDDGKSVSFKVLLRPPQ